MSMSYLEERLNEAVEAKSAKPKKKTDAR
jgi:hypothetical protein